MKLLGVFILLTSAIPTLSAVSNSYPTPEAALAEYVEAYKARDVERFLAAINFNQEATEILQASSEAVEEPTDAQVQERASGLKSDLRAHFTRFGFKAATFDNCQTINKFQDTDVRVRFVLGCVDSRGGSTFPVRVMRFTQGWQVVRGT